MLSDYERLEREGTEVDEVVRSSLFLSLLLKGRQQRQFKLSQCLGKFIVSEQKIDSRSNTCLPSRALSDSLKIVSTANDMGRETVVA